MDTSIEARRRNIIPRWRDFKTTLALGELRSAEALSDDQVGIEGSLDEQLVDWQNNPSLSFATDLVGAGLVLGQDDHIQDAVDFILSPESESTELQRRVARRAQNIDFT